MLICTFVTNGFGEKKSLQFQHYFANGREGKTLHIDVLNLIH